MRAWRQLEWHSHLPNEHDTTNGSTHPTLHTGLGTSVFSLEHMVAHSPSWWLIHPSSFGHALYSNVLNVENRNNLSVIIVVRFSHLSAFLQSIILVIKYVQIVLTTYFLMWDWFLTIIRKIFLNIKYLMFWYFQMLQLNFEIKNSWFRQKQIH